jgi:hypothetical protein
MRAYFQLRWSRVVRTDAAGQSGRLRAAWKTVFSVTLTGLMIRKGSTPAHDSAKLTGGISSGVSPLLGDLAHPTFIQRY